ncbi:LolA family protein [Candidatus Deianiraea vastatrix]|uniref:Outer-membrane lipoprotein carrier protein n=1 Tax=Candidatus Deianiraea vastatrix TaxID=2163644 RepID=A0A5B8XG13_9RICK|nr:outer membrane lipoprotein carrier protein LolA [Candidatus Deianiraea vastatrix]QED23815.1 Outer-membrane lipoprotein carrier protein [Candidatus Deianiraea vastatrix]
MKSILSLILITFFVNTSLAKENCTHLEKYDNALSSISTMQADFTQNINGKYHSSGKFLMKKPEKILIDYNKGAVNALIGVNGKLATYLDKDLEQISHIPKDKTPAHFLLNTDKQLSKMNIQECSDEKNGGYAITFLQATDIVSGKFTMIFDKNAVISKILVEQGDGDLIDLTFTNVALNGEIPNSKFIIKDPRL